MRRWLPIASGCEREVAGAALFFLVSGLLWWSFPNFWLMVLSVFALALFSLFLIFFRDPERVPPLDPTLLVSPADGRVVAIKTLDDALIGHEAIRVSIFLSLFDVHVNRVPYEAQVVSVKHEAGQFKNAAFADASEVNERNTLVLQSGQTKFIVRQIAGLVARRIVCWAQPGQTLGRGERFGLIKFGSRVDLILPRGTRLLVKVGSTVRGGSTSVAQFNP